VKLHLTPREFLQTPGFDYEVVDGKGGLICAGWCAGGKVQVRDEALMHAQRTIRARARKEAAAVTGEGVES
jgi:hypothetical protein